MGPKLCVCEPRPSDFKIVCVWAPAIWTPNRVWAPAKWAPNCVFVSPGHVSPKLCVCEPLPCEPQIVRLWALAVWNPNSVCEPWPCEPQECEPQPVYLDKWLNANHKWSVLHYLFILYITLKNARDTHKFEICTQTWINVWSKLLLFENWKEVKWKY